jgi:hypothetical protein
MKLDAQLFSESIQPKKVYYFESSKLGTNIPHYFICLSRSSDEMLVLVCCTTQFEKRSRYIESRGLPLSTLVWIKPDSENGLRQDSYVDCNGYFDYSIEELKQLYEDDMLDYKGEISDSHFEQILIGIKASPVVEEFIKDLLPITS